MPQGEKYFGITDRVRPEPEGEKPAPSGEKPELTPAPALTKEEEQRLLAIEARIDEILAIRRSPDKWNALELEEVKALANEFTALQKEKRTLELKKEGKEAFLIIVQDALDPFREAFLAGGVPEAQVPERKEIQINLIELLKQDQKSYQQSGLKNWASALEGLEAKLGALSPEKRQILEQEIKDGAIPIFMPGAKVQLKTTIQQIKTSFKPVLVKDSQPKAVYDISVWEHTENLITKKAKKLVADVPENPYILLTKPTQKPEGRTTNKTVGEQKKELQVIQEERKQAGRADVFVTNIAEYLALQKQFTSRVKTQAPQALKELNPLDEKTWSCFINLPLSSDGLVPGGSWGSDNPRVVLARGDAGCRDSLSGFRLSVRVEI